MSLFLLPFALLVTDEPTAITPPTNHIVGRLWTYVADNGPFTAIGPRLTCSVQHVGVFEPVFQGVLYHIEKVIEPPGSDVRFMVLRTNIASGYATLATNFVFEQACWVVAGGAGTGTVQGGTNYVWGDQATKRKRWSYSGRVVSSALAQRYNWRFDACATADGDSGYACFTEDGRYLGPISGEAVNPKTLKGYGNTGEMIMYYLDWIRDYLPPQTNAPPKPKVPVAVTISSP